MAGYEINFKPSVEKDFRKIPNSHHAEILDKIKSLSELPRPNGVTKLTGSDILYRIRCGDYRVIYEINDKIKNINICYVRHRKDAYRDI
jgi:mRNA interferase RelE/StbE